MLPKMKASHFVKKYSVQFVNASRQAVGAVLLRRQQAARVLADLAGRPQRVRPDDARQRPRARRRRPRGRARAGRAVRGRPGRRRARADTRAARAREVRAKVVVDASGQSALLQNRFKLRVWDPVLNKGAIWTYWKGAYRDTGRDEGATLVHPDRRTSRAGSGTSRCTTTSSASASSRRSTTCSRAAAATSRPTTRRSSAARRSRSASRTRTRVTGYFATKDYSYRSKQVAGDGWVLVGDAFGFLDPLYSSGVLLALQVGRAGRRRDRRGAGEGRHVGGAARQVGPDVQRGRGPDAAAGVRVLRRLQLRQVRPQLPAPARAR